MHEATAVSQPILHFERFLDSREAAALLTRDANRKIMAIPHFRFRRVGRPAVKVRQLSAPSLTTEDRDETDEISARQPSACEACPRPECMGSIGGRTLGGRLSQATLSDRWFGRTVSERGVGQEGRRRTSSRHQR
jgi:hypothetical protein